MKCTTKRIPLISLVLLLVWLLALPAGAQTVSVEGACPVIDLSAYSAFGAKYKKIQIASVDNSSANINWATAVTTCANATNDGKDDWRVPTVTELRFIWALHPQLKSVASSAAFSAGYYWGGAPDGTDASVWCVGFGNGSVYNSTKTDTYRLRCVRDL